MPSKNKRVAKSGKGDSPSRLNVSLTRFITALDSFKSRRPHRSFKRTRRRDYVRSLELPGYFAFTRNVFTLIRGNLSLFVRLTVLSAILGITLVGVASQSTYSELSKLIDTQDWSNTSVGWSVATQGVALLFLGFTGGFNAQLTDIQQVYAVIVFLLTWLTTVWLLRSLFADHKPKLRDAVYNAGAPIVSTGMIMLIMFIQFVPAIIGGVLFSAAYSSGLLESGVISMLAGIGLVLLCILSVYWAVATFFALIIVTLPGMYPWQAIRSAGDIVVGRRLRLLLRIVWMLAGNALALVIVMLPLVLIDRWIKGLLPVIEPVPVVPVTVSLIGSAIVVWSATYIYALYRKVVEDDASPA